MEIGEEKSYGGDIVLLTVAGTVLVCGTEMKNRVQ
jgi:hypothetical protein